METEERIAVVVNPSSADGRTARLWPALEQALRKQPAAAMEFFHTREPGHAGLLTRAALERGFTRIISTGGDGTHYEVLNGFFEDGVAIAPEASLALLPQGTGSDLARTLRLPKGLEAVSLCCTGAARRVDAGCIRLTRPDGSPGTVYFLNTCHIGIGGEVAALVNGNSKRFGGLPSFLWGTLKALARYEDKLLRMVIDGEVREQPVKDLIIAKGRYDGGGMLIAPNATMDSGVFEVCIVGPVSLPQAVCNLHRLYRGTLHQRPDIVEYLRAKRIEISCAEALHVSPDGELPGFLPATIEVLPQALQLVTPEQRRVPSGRAKLR